jgi:hypothetical protein
MPAWLMLPPLLLVGLLTWSCIRPIEVQWGAGGFTVGRYFNMGPYAGLTTWADGGILIYPIPPPIGAGSYLFLWGKEFKKQRQDWVAASAAAAGNAAPTSGASVQSTLPLEINRQANGTRVQMGKPAILEFALPPGWRVELQQAPQRLSGVGADDLQIRAEHLRTKTLLSIYGAILDDEMQAKAILDPVGAARKNVVSNGERKDGVKYYWMNQISKKKTRRYRSIKLRKGRVVLEAAAILPRQTPPEKLAAVDAALKELQETVRIQAP